MAAMDQSTPPTAPSSGQDEWTVQPPYAAAGPGHFDAKWKGTCHCGRVEYQISRNRPLASKYCHCRVCQRLHGVWHGPIPPSRTSSE